MSSSSSLLPVQGFVLAGGRSSRMGQDKARLLFEGQPLVERALGALRSFCAEVAIAGNRDDLAALAPVVQEHRPNTGPAAGLEAGLLHSRQPWALFMPVDVPGVSATLLRAWTEAVLRQEGSGVRLSYLRVLGEQQPAFCLLHRETVAPLAAALDAGERRLSAIYGRIAEALGPASVREAQAEEVFPGELTEAELRHCFLNLNTPEDLLSVHTPRKTSRDMRQGSGSLPDGSTFFD